MQSLSDCDSDNDGIIDERCRRRRRGGGGFALLCACCLCISAIAVIGILVYFATRPPAPPCPIPSIAAFTSECCDISQPSCIMAVDLRLLNAQFGATAGSPSARYSLGECFASAELIADTTVLTSDSVVPLRSSARVTLDSSGAFSVAVPLRATDVQTSVRLPSPDGTFATVAAMRFAPMRTDSDAYRRRSLLSTYSRAPALLSQHLMLEYANRIAYDASGYDSTPAEGNSKPAGEQGGPHRSSRALAIVQIAVLDAMIAGGAAPYEPYALDNLGSLPKDVSIEAAIAAATHKTLVHLFPSQQKILDHAYETMLDPLLVDSTSEARVQAGIELGELSAQAVIEDRANDGSAHKERNVGAGPDDYHLVSGPGEWAPDPISGFQVALGSEWAKLVRPFTLDSADQFRAPRPSLSSPDYLASYSEAKALGGDGKTTATTRDADQTELGIYYAYDGSFVLCAPPRLYNQLLAQLAAENIDTPAEYARLLALANIAMADAGIAAWESKWYYRLWRPVTAIRAPAPFANLTLSDPTWTPLGAPGSNGGVWFTPPFPAYPSGHATFGAAMAEVVRRVIGRDNVPLTFVSDELNGKTVGVDGHVRPLKPRSFMSLSELEMSNAFSRIPLGIHWRIDAASGIEMGHKVARQTLARVYTLAKRR